MKHLLDISVNAENSKLATLRPEGSGCGYRIAGPKAWGGSRDIANLKISSEDLATYIAEYAPEVLELLKGSMTKGDKN